MQTVDQLLEDLISRKQRLDALKAHSEEVTEALQLAEEYYRLYAELVERCKQPTQYVPYPVYPYNPWNPIMITWTTDSTAKTIKYDATCAQNSDSK